MSESEYDSEYSDRNHNNDVVGNSNESDYKSCDDSGHGEHNNDENSDDESIVDVGADIGSIGFKEENVKRRVSLDDDDDNDYDYDDGSGGGDSDDEDDTGCDVDDGSSGGGDSDDEDKEIGDGIGFERGNSNGNVDEDRNNQTEAAKLKILVDMKFNTAEYMTKYMEAYAKQENFNLAFHPTYYKEAESIRIFGINEGQQKRLNHGNFYCTGSKTGKVKCPCNFYVGFAYFAQKKGDPGYYIKETKFNLNHTSHEKTNLTYKGTVMITKQKQFNHDELEFIKGAAEFNENSGLIREKMNSRFAGRMFDVELIRRQIKLFQKEIFGKNGQCLNKLMMIGNDLIRNGGIFNITHNGCMRLNSIIVQTSEMGLYAKQYNDFIMVDGTHGTNQYSLIMMPVTAIDCLGKSIITAIGMCEAETRQFTSLLLETCGLNNAEGTLMTDEGTGFFGVGDKYGMNHLLCAQHFQKKFKNISGLGGCRVEVEKSWNKLLFHSLSSEEWMTEYNSTLNIIKALSKVALEKGNENPSAEKYWTGLFDSRLRVCKTFTKKVFSCGHTSTSRAEGTNARVKGNGALKKLLKKAEIDRSISRVLDLVKNQEGKALQTIKGYIKANKKWSDYVDGIWKENVSHTSRLVCIAIEASSDSEKICYNISRKKDMKTISKVTIPRQKGAFSPTCTCGSFSSRKIPCTCICAVFSSPSVSQKLFVEDNLHPRWRLVNHPLYAKAKIHLGIDDGTVENCCLDQGNMTVDHITYNRIEYPATQNIRYARLKEQFELAARHAKENEEIYKKFMVLLSSAVNSYNCVGTAEQDQPNNCVQPPLSQVDRRKRGRVSDSDVQNRAKYPKKSKSGSTRAKPNNVSLTM